MDSEMRILHVDDEASIRDLTKTFLERQDQQFSVETAPSADKGLEKLTDRPPDCIVSDYNMPGMDGLEFLQTVREEYPDLPFILFTGKGSETVASDAIAAGVTDYLQKSGGAEQYDLLANRIRNAVDARREAKRADRQEQLMRLTEFAGETGGFEIDTEAGEVLRTDGTRRIMNLPEQTTPNFETNLQHFHPDDQKKIRRSIQQALQTGGQTHSTLRYQCPDGEKKLLDIAYTPVTTNGDTTTIRGAIHDVTEKRQRQEQLETEQRLINQALDALEDIFYVIDTDGTLRRWNETACNVTGYSDSELDGMLAIETFPEDEHEKIAAAVETALTDGETTVEADLLTADGERLPYEFKGARLTDDDGEPTGLVGVGRDLTDRRQQEQRFQALVEESNDLITIVDAEGVFQYQSPSMERLLGYDPENTLGETAWEFVHPDDRANLIEAFERGVADPDANPVTVYRARHADGSWRWMEARGNNQLDNPAVEGYVVNSRDITKRKERERELEQYKTLVEALTDPVYVVDEEGRFTHVNDKFVELVGYDRETILGSRPSLIKTDDSVDRADTQLSRVLSTDGPDTVSFEVTIQPRTGEPLVCEDHMGVLPYDGEAFEGSVGVLRDITEQKEYEQRIEAENERLSEFAGIVSHDLRNPLGVVEARLQLAQEECDSDHLQKATDALARSQALIEDLLTLAREGRKVTDLEPVELPAVAEGCWNSVATGQATLEVAQLPVITADRSRVKQLFENLYRNAVEHGGTDVTVSVGAMDDGFYVADTGPGIPESEWEAVFEAGYSTNQEGTGFGLRIVEEVADAHGWEVAVTESTQGGARFEMTGVETVE